MSLTIFGRDSFWSLESVIPFLGKQWLLGCDCPAKDCIYQPFLPLGMVRWLFLNSGIEYEEYVLPRLSLQKWVWELQALFLIWSSECRRETTGSYGWWLRVQYIRSLDFWITMSCPLTKNSSLDCYTNKRAKCPLCFNI